MKVKIISIASILVLGIVVALITISSAVSRNNEYESYLASARKFVGDNVPYTACQKYKQAFSVKCDDESVYNEYLEQSKLVDESVYNDAVKDYIVYFPESPKAYEELCKYYYVTESYRNVIKVAQQARDLGIANDKVKEYYLNCYYMYKYIKTGLDDAASFLGDYALVKKNGLYGYITSGGTFLISPRFQEAKQFMGSSAAVFDGTEWYMINTGGYKIARPTEKIEELSFLSNGKMLYKRNGKYGYTDSTFALGETVYDDATNFKNNIGAVKKGDKWALIDSSEKQITEYIFDDIILDEYKTCINNGVVFAKIDGMYYMYDKEGKRISDNGFDNAYPFVSAEPAAICIDGKWGFADSSGNVVIEPSYSNAKSFSNGLAPVSKDGMWGYINSSGETRIEMIFTDCLPFSNLGVAAVKENDVWNYIKLLAYFE